MTTKTEPGLQSTLRGKRAVEIPLLFLRFFYLTYSVDCKNEFGKRVFLIVTKGRKGAVEIPLLFLSFFLLNI